MRRLVILFTALLALGLVPLTAGPAAADPPVVPAEDGWGFWSGPSTVPAGGEVITAMRSAESHAIPDAGPDLEPLAIRVFDQECGGNEPSRVLTNRYGAPLATDGTRTSAFGLLEPVRLVVPAATSPGGVYYLRQTCQYNKHFVGALHVPSPDERTATACVGINVTAAGSSPGATVNLPAGSGRLFHDPCPVSIETAVMGALLGVGSVVRPTLPPGTSPVTTPGAAPSVTTTTRPVSPGAPGQSGGGTPAGPVDASPPQLSGLSFNPGCGSPAGVQVNASDDVGVTSVTFTASTGASGSMSGGGTYSATFYAPPGTSGINVTVTARDAAGHTTTASTSGDTGYC